MDPETVPSEESTPGTAGTWSRRRRLTLGLTALALVAGGGVAIAAGSPDDPQVAVGVGKLAVPAKGDLRGGILHSEAVTSDGNGGYVTHLTQVGKIESVDADNLTVVSDDGYKRAWKRTSDTVVGGANWSVTKNDDGSWTVRKATEELASGQQVLVIGTLSGDEATAQRIAAQPEAGDLPPGILKRFGGEEGSDAAGKLKQRMMERFGGEGGGMPGPGMMGGPMDGQMGGPMGGPGGEVRKFEFRTGPNGESGTVTAPAPGESFGKGGAIPAPSAPEAPDSSATPVEPSSAYAGSGSMSFT
jgi:hypothetical protein